MPQSARIQTYFQRATTLTVILLEACFELASHVGDTRLVSDGAICQFDSQKLLTKVLPKLILNNYWMRFL